MANLGDLFARRKAPSLSPKAKREIADWVRNAPEIKERAFLRDVQETHKEWDGHAALAALAEVASSMHSYPPTGKPSALGEAASADRSAPSGR